jgi:long-chain acyl-CoA synthetase
MPANPQVKPTMLVAVPVVFNRIYDKVHDKLKRAGGLKSWAFSRGMLVARERREWLDAPVDSRPKYTPWLWLRWQLVSRLVFSSVTNLLGGELKMCLTGGAALSPVIQQWYADLGIPVRWISISADLLILL